MDLEKKIEQPRKRRLRFGLKTLITIVIAATTPFIPIKFYEGKPWHPGNFNNRYVEKRYWSLSGIEKYKTYRVYGKDPIVDKICLSIYYPDWMYRLPAWISTRLPPRQSSPSHATREVWLRGQALKEYPDVSVDRWHIIPPEKDPEARACFEEADALFQKYYSKNKSMPFEPTNEERWALFPWLYKN